MGGAESRFNTLLIEGSEEAIQMWKENFAFQAKYQLNTQLKASLERDTPLHCAVRHEMKELIQEFLSNGSDFFAMNGNGETPLHLVCRAGKISSRKAKRRSEFLQMMLDRIPTKDTGFEVVRTSPSLERSKGQGGKGRGSTSNGPTVNGTLSNLFSKENGKVGTSHKTPVISETNRLGIQDRSHNTPLHLAAASGLLECVELLVAHEAPLFVRNVAGQMPCDVAWEAKEIVIAKQLESKMVWDSDVLHGKDEHKPYRQRNKSFHDTHALQRLKQDIINGVAQKIEVPPQAAKALLMTYGWSEELVREAWHSDRAGACEKAGLKEEEVRVSPPPAAYSQDEGSSRGQEAELECGICFSEIPSRQAIRVPCQHFFCKDCWKSHVEVQINEGGGKEIRCPGVDCFTIVPDSVIAQCVSEGQMDRYTKLTLQQFVASSADIRWCPYPDCGYAICMRREAAKEERKEVGGASSRNGGVSSQKWGEEKYEDKEKEAEAARANDVGGASNGETSALEWSMSSMEGVASGGVEVKQLTRGENVECGQGHGFCWNCSKDPHEPASCELWARWKEVVTNNMSEEDLGRVAQEAQANAQWIIRNTKPCPNCNSPIQKNEGCNHMTCKTCHHDFCWVCLDPWSMHSHRTGGYFTCNRWAAQNKANKAVKKHQNSLEQEYVKKAHHDIETQQRKFEHYHDRYNNHLQSLDFEMKQLQESKAKLREMERLGQALDKKVAVVKAKVLMDTVEFADEACRSFPNLQGKNFLDDIFRTLLHARRILAASYCIGFFLPEEKKKATFDHEALQGELENVVEILSQMVNREYLHSTRHHLSEAAQNVEKQCELYLSGVQEIADIAGRFVMGIEDEETKRKREERERLRQQQAEEEEEEEAHGQPTLEELMFFEHLIRLMDGNGRLHILVPPPAANGQ